MSAAAAQIPTSVFEIMRHRSNAAEELASRFDREYHDSYLLPVTRPRFVAEERLTVLADALRRDTFAYSNPQRVLSHPAMREIQSMGDENVRFALARLDKEPTLWLTVLPAIVGETAVKRRHQGRVPKMVADWKSWARKRGYNVR